MSEQSRPSRPPRDAYLVVGRVLGPHGVHGDVRVRSYTEHPESLRDHRFWLLRSPAGESQRVEVLKTHPARWGLHVRLAGVSDRDAAERLRDSEVLLERAAFPATEAHEFYQDDLLGCSVRDREGVLLGELTHFVEAPSGVLMVVRGARERWLPARPPYLRRVDLERREVTVEWPEDF